MRKRAGFVSNSSSSSFLIVGVSLDVPWWDSGVANLDTDDIALLRALGFTKATTIEEAREDITLGYGNDYATKAGHEFVVVGYDNPDYVGINAEKPLEAGMTLAQIKEMFKQQVAECGYDVRKLGKVGLFYGEAGNG